MKSVLNAMLIVINRIIDLIINIINMFNDLIYKVRGFIRIRENRYKNQGQKGFQRGSWTKTFQRSNRNQNRFDKNRGVEKGYQVRKTNDEKGGYKVRGEGSDLRWNKDKKQIKSRPYNKSQDRIAHKGFRYTERKQVNKDNSEEIKKLISIATDMNEAEKERNKSKKKKQKSKKDEANKGKGRMVSDDESVQSTNSWSSIEESVEGNTLETDEWIKQINDKGLYYENNKGISMITFDVNKIPEMPMNTDKMEGSSYQNEVLGKLEFKIKKFADLIGSVITAEVMFGTELTIGPNHIMNEMEENTYKLNDVLSTTNKNLSFPIKMWNKECSKYKLLGITRDEEIVMMDCEMIAVVPNYIGQDCNKGLKRPLMFVAPSVDAVIYSGSIIIQETEEYAIPAVAMGYMTLRSKEKQNLIVVAAPWNKIEGKYAFNSRI